MWRTGWFTFRWLWFYPFRRRLRCPNQACPGVGTYKPYRAFEHGCRRFLCKFCGWYEDAWVRGQMCYADRDEKVWKRLDAIPDDDLKDGGWEDRFTTPMQVLQGKHGEKLGVQRINPFIG